MLLIIAVKSPDPVQWTVQAIALTFDWCSSESILVVRRRLWGVDFVSRRIHDTRTVATADLLGVDVSVTTAAVGGPLLVPAVKDSVTALALAVVVQGRTAAARAGPEDTLTDVPAAAAMRGATVGLLVVAAGVVPAVDDAIAAAVRVRAVNPPDDRTTAAPVGTIVVDLRTAAGAVQAVLPNLDRVPAADGIAVVVRSRIAAARVLAVRLAYDFAATAADLRLVVVDARTTAARTAAVLLVSQLSTAADLLVSVVHLSVAAAVRAVPVVRKIRSQLKHASYV